MFGEYTYILLMAFTFLGPFIMSFEKKIHFIENLKFFFPANIIMMLYFITWDVLFTKNNIWSFNPEYHLNFEIINLPIEEWLFFICVPFACLFIYENVKYFNKVEFNSKIISISIIILLSTILLITDNGLYTQITFISLILMIIISINKSFMLNFYLGYLVSLIPFFLVNGVLTATPVVLYNDNENLAFRLYTIPFEDIFYGMLMMLQVTYFYEFFKNKLNKKK